MEKLKEPSSLTQCWLFCTFILFWNDPVNSQGGNPKSPSPLHGASSTRQGSAREAKQPHHSLNCPKLRGKKAAKKYQAQVRIEPSHWWWGGWSGFNHFKPGTGLMFTQETPEGCKRWLENKKEKKIRKQICLSHIAMSRMNDFPSPLTNGWGGSYKNNHHIHLKWEVDVAVAKQRCQRCNLQQDLDPGHFQAECIKMLSLSFGAAVHFGANVQICYGFFFFFGGGDWSSQPVHLIWFHFLHAWWGHVFLHVWAATWERWNKTCSWVRNKAGCREKLSMEQISFTFFFSTLTQHKEPVWGLRSVKRGVCLSATVSVRVREGEEWSKFIFGVHSITESQNPTRVWVERDFKDHLLPTLLPQSICRGFTLCKGIMWGYLLPLQWRCWPCLPCWPHPGHSDTPREMPKSGCPALPGEPHLQGSSQAEHLWHTVTFVRALGTLLRCCLGCPRSPGINWNIC